VTRIIKAIYEHGVLRPLEPLGLPENARVDVTIETSASEELNGCVGSISAEDAADMRAIIEREFEQVDPRDW
jgi:predicted DNA-binding antitoxin AbrB/MazE fold protein